MNWSAPWDVPNRPGTNPYTNTIFQEFRLMKPTYFIKPTHIFESIFIVLIFSCSNTVVLIAIQTLSWNTEYVKVVQWWLSPTPMIMSHYLNSLFEGRILRTRRIQGLLAGCRRHHHHAHQWPGSAKWSVALHSGYRKPYTPKILA